jgi:hypothetical protein
MLWDQQLLESQEGAAPHPFKGNGKSALVTFFLISFGQS